MYRPSAAMSRASDSTLIRKAGILSRDELGTARVTFNIRTSTRLIPLVFKTNDISFPWFCQAGAPLFLPLASLHQSGRLLQARPFGKKRIHADNFRQQQPHRSNRRGDLVSA